MIEGHTGIRPSGKFYEGIGVRRCRSVPGLNIVGDETLGIHEPQGTKQRGQPAIRVTYRESAWQLRD